MHDACSVQESFPILPLLSIQEGGSVPSKPLVQDASPILPLFCSHAEFPRQELSPIEGCWISWSDPVKGRPYCDGYFSPSNTCSFWKRILPSWFVKSPWICLGKEVNNSLSPPIPPSPSLNGTKLHALVPMQLLLPIVPEALSHADSPRHDDSPMEDPSIFIGGNGGNIIGSFNSWRDLASGFFESPWVAKVYPNW